MNKKHILAGLSVALLIFAPVLAIDTTNLNNTGAELGGFLINLAPGLEAFIFKIGIAVMILGLIGGIIFMIKKIALSFDKVF